MVRSLQVEVSHGTLRTGGGVTWYANSLLQVNAATFLLLVIKLEVTYSVVTGTVLGGGGIVNDLCDLTGLIAPLHRGFT